MDTSSTINLTESVVSEKTESNPAVLPVTTTTTTSKNGVSDKKKPKSTSDQSTNGGPEDTNDEKKEPPSASSTWKTKTLAEKARFVQDFVTVEPMVLLFILSVTFCKVAVDNLAIEKACRVNLNYTSDVCDAVIYSEDHNYIQELTNSVQAVSAMNTWSTALASGISLIIILFVGSYSDRHKLRKPFLILPILGELISMCVTTVSVVFMDSWPMEVIGLSNAIFPSVVGGLTTFQMAFYAYIADVSTVEMRTLRIGIIHMVAQIGAPVSLLAAAVTFESIGYYGMFGTSIVLYALAILYGIFKIKEPKSPTNVTKRNFFVDFFDPRHVVETCKVLTKKREGTLKLQVLLLIFVFIVTVGPDSGTGSIGYNYTKVKFQWLVEQYGIWLAADTVVHMFGTTVAIVVLSKMLGIADALLGCIAALTRIVIDFIYAFAKVGWMMYIGSVVGFFVGIGNVAVRSLSTKLVAEDELGQMQSLFGIVDAVIPLVYNPLYNYMFTRTVQTFPGSFLLLGAAMIAPAVFIYIWIFYLQRKDERNSRKHGEDNECGEFRYTVPMSDL